MLMLVFLMITLMRAGVEMLLWHSPLLDALVESLLVVQVGLAGLYAFFGPYFVSYNVAGSVGWLAAGALQKEASIANLAFGVLGILCFWLHGNFWLATGIGAIVFWLGAASVRIGEMRRRCNVHFGNVSALLLSDIGMPVLLLGLLGAYLIKG
jgi:hypothetical protein